MDNENLYESVKNQICGQIFEGVYGDGDKLPPERLLAEALDVSRVTVRKSMELLEKDHLVVREVGRGTRVHLPNRGNPCDLDMIVLIAPAKNPFFAEFIAQFQAYAEEKNSLLLYVEKPKAERLEHCLYRLYKRGLRNVVIWLEDLPVEADQLMRLRAIGMNLVFFDTDKGLPYGDCVTVDNQNAIRSLYQGLKTCQCEEVIYAGWDVPGVYSIRERETVYRKLAGLSETEKQTVWQLNWKERHNGVEQVMQRLKQSRIEQSDYPQAILCSDRECGELVLKAVNQMKLQIPVASVDRIFKAEEGTEVPVLFYEQNLEQTVRKIHECLKKQCTEGDQWIADLYRIEGRMYTIH